jgi:hypothetical protein
MKLLETKREENEKINPMNNNINITIDKKPINIQILCSEASDGDHKLRGKEELIPNHTEDEEENSVRIKDDQERLVEYRKIYKMLQHKKKVKNKITPSVYDFLCMRWGLSFCKKGKKKKYELYEKCNEIIDNTVEINHLIRKLFELEFMKKLIMSENQIRLLKYQFQYINLSNFDDSLKFLQMFNQESEKLPKEIFEDPWRENPKYIKSTDEKLLEGLRNYYNY